jgi:hypothetical protein
MESKVPYVAVAVFCEKVLREVDGVLSAVRIIDRVIVVRQPVAGKQSEIPTIPMTIFVGLKGGEFTGKGTLRLVASKPSGTQYGDAPVETEVEIGNTQGGASVVINANFKFPEVGVYWFNVEFDGRVLSRMPLEVVLADETPESSISDAGDPANLH